MSNTVHESGNDTLNRELRKLPQVEVLLTDRKLKPLIERFSRLLVTTSIQKTLETVRAGIIQGNKAPARDELINWVESDLDKTWPGFRSPVINATGVVLHTNLGRAPLPAAVLESAAGLCSHFSVLEYDLTTGKRGRRAERLERLLCILTGAEAALVVNNNAAAMLLVLVAVANGREAIVSRGELVQIGGGFRVPEIIEQGGVTLKEVGTTNHTCFDDYEKAITDDTALLLKVHRSNFAIRGFTSEVTISELKELGTRHGLPVVYDIGSGSFFNTEDYGMEHEPTVPEAMSEGADIICFSGDKLLGGPQSGIIIGKEKYISMLRKHQLLRAVRIDKLVAATLEEVVMIYLNKEARQKLPVWQMAGYQKSEISQRAVEMSSNLCKQGVTAEVIDGFSTIGGGSLPDQTLPTTLIAIKPEIQVDEFASRLRLGAHPVIGRIENGKYLVDLRTVFINQENILQRKILENFK